MGQSHPLNDPEKAWQYLNDPAQLEKLHQFNEIILANQLQPHEELELKKMHEAIAFIKQAGPSEIGGEDRLTIQDYNELKAKIDADIVPLQHRQREAQRATEEKKRLEDNKDLIRMLLTTNMPRTNEPNAPATTDIPAKSSTSPNGTPKLTAVYLAYEQYKQGLLMLKEDGESDEVDLPTIYNRLTEKVQDGDTSMKLVKLETWCRYIRRAREKLGLPPLNASPGIQPRSAVNFNGGQEPRTTGHRRTNSKKIE